MLKQIYNWQKHLSVEKKGNSRRCLDNLWHKPYLYLQGGVSSQSHICLYEWELWLMIWVCRALFKIFLNILKGWVHFIFQVYVMLQICVFFSRGKSLGRHFFPDLSFCIYYIKGYLTWIVPSLSSTDPIRKNKLTTSMDCVLNIDHNWSVSLSNFPTQCMCDRCD